MALSAFLSRDMGAAPVFVQEIPPPPHSQGNLMLSPTYKVVVGEGIGSLC